MASLALGYRDPLVTSITEYLVIMEILPESMCALQRQLGYVFTRPELLREALTHRSCVHQQGVRKRQKRNCKL